MRPLAFIRGGAAALIALACASSLRVSTMVAPDAHLSSLATFHVLPVPRPRDGRPRSDAYDPMVNNSIANRALREAIARAFVDRGYLANDRAPDFEVAVYASAREKLDVARWDYGYPYWPRWGRPYYGPPPVVTEYTEGTVVVDVIRPRTRDLLWRGSATARLSENPVEDLKQLQKVAAAVVAKFPRAAQRPVALVP